MVNGNDILEFEEENFASLIVRFIDLHKKEWDDFLMDAYNDHQAMMIDTIKDVVKGVDY